MKGIVLIIVYLLPKLCLQQYVDVSDLYDKIVNEDIRPPRPNILTPKRDEILPDKSRKVLDRGNWCFTFFDVYRDIGLTDTMTEYERKHCGKSSYGLRRKRIIGAQNTPGLHLRHPWTVIVVTEYHLVGDVTLYRKVTTGTIIHRHYVLASKYGLPKGIREAMNLQWVVAVKIIAGQETDNYEQAIDAPYAYITVPSELILYMDQDIDEEHKQHLGLALIHIPCDLPFNENIRPVCIPAIPHNDPVDIEDKRKCQLAVDYKNNGWATGFGSIDAYSGVSPLNQGKFQLSAKCPETGAMYFTCVTKEGGNPTCSAAESDHGAPIQVHRNTPINNTVKSRIFATSITTFTMDNTIQVIATDLIEAAPWIAASIKMSEDMPLANKEDCTIQ